MKLQILIVFLSAVLLFSQFTTAEYISGEIRLDENGFATFNIQTDVEIQTDQLEFKNERLTGRTDSFTEKRNSIWTFSFEGATYDDIFIDIKLPSATRKITLIQGNRYLLDTEENILTLIDSGELNFKVSYMTGERTNYSFVYYLIGIIILILVFFIFYKIKKKKDRMKFIMPLINENEQKIIDLLMKGQMKQKEVRKRIGLTKASFSRYVVNLEKKKLIYREGEGKNKILRLK